MSGSLVCDPVCLAFIWYATASLDAGDGGTVVGTVLVVVLDVVVGGTVVVVVGAATVVVVGATVVEARPSWWSSDEWSSWSA